MDGSSQHRSQARPNRPHSTPVKFSTRQFTHSLWPHGRAKRKKKDQRQEIFRAKEFRPLASYPRYLLDQTPTVTILSRLKATKTMQPPTSDSQNNPGLALLESADQRARLLPTNKLPDILVFDTDSKRMGDYGGFFLASDYNAALYNVAGASDDPKSKERVNSPTSRIPGVHLPSPAHFALVAAGPLFTTAGSFHFEAIVYCREVTHKDTGQTALLKLTTKGPAAVKLHHHFTIGISDPLTRITDHYHQLAHELFQTEAIPKDRLDTILKSQATPQMIWIPVEISRAVQIGRAEDKSVIGAMVFTDEPLENTQQFKSRWPSIPLQTLINADTNGGLLLTGSLQQYCQSNRLQYEAILHTRAASKGVIQELPQFKAETSISQSNSTTTIQQIRARLTAIGKSENSPDVVARMNQFGAPRLDLMLQPQLEAFNIYVEGFISLRNKRRAQLQTRSDHTQPTTT
jgi:hypothetical protein